MLPKTSMPAEGQTPASSNKCAACLGECQLLHLCNVCFPSTAQWSSHRYGLLCLHTFMSVNAQGCMLLLNTSCTADYNNKTFVATPMLFFQKHCTRLLTLWGCTVFIMLRPMPLCPNVL